MAMAYRAQTQAIGGTTVGSLLTVALDRLTPGALRERFTHPPVWTPEHSVEKSFSDRQPALAAVLLPLVMRDELTLLLTERSSMLSTHSGQIAFPGGRTDETDANAVDTALREAQEEIALPRNFVEVLGTLPTYVTGSAFIITPVVALVKPSVLLTISTTLSASWVMVAVSGP